jgi:flavoprotein
MSKTSLTVSSKNQGSISLTINDALDLILKSPMVTQVFAKAVAGVATTLVAGTVTEVVVTIGEQIDRVDYEMHQQKLHLKTAKLDATTKICANAVAKAESNPDFPPEMKEELKNRLYKLFYSEMKKIAP